jgi:nicotinate-nucleotide--dimethylbenzimidazole phosphoribosyltransferase
MTLSALPFDDLRQLLGVLPEAAASAPSLASLGRVGELARFVRAWRGAAPIERPTVALFAGSHGHAPEATLAEARARMQAISGETAPVARLCRAADIGLRVFELALELPAGDIFREPGLEEVACAATAAYGMEAIAAGPDLLCIGALGPGAELGAAGVCHVLFGGEARLWAAGLEDADAADRLERIGADRRSAADPLELLRRFGGREMAAMVGAIVAARMERVPVILDGLPAVAAGALLSRLNDRALDHCLAAQAGPAGALRRALDALDMPPLLDLGSEAENCGAPLAALIVKSAAAAL